MANAMGGTLPEDAAPPAARAAATTADLALCMTAEPARVMVDDILTYTITVENRGPDAARGVVVVCALPGDLADPAYSLDGGECFQPWHGSASLGALAAGSRATLLLAAQVETRGNGYILSTAEVSAEVFDPDPSNDSCCCLVTTGMAGSAC